MTIKLNPGGPTAPELTEVLAPPALDFLGKLQRAFNARRLELLQKRAERQAAIDSGERPDFLASTAHVRAGDWKVAAIPADLQRRRVEITGPTDKKMLINALN